MKNRLIQQLWIKWPVKNFHKKTGIVIVCLLLAANICFAQEWPPLLDEKNPVTQSVKGQTIERYVHGIRKKWGYPAGTQGDYPEAQETGSSQQNINSFYVVAPTTPQKNAPLYVVLHSAGRTAYDYVGYSYLGRKIDPNDDPATTLTNPPDDFYALFLNSTNDEWWGWGQIRKSGEQGNAPSPAELRVLETIEWVVTNYEIDRNRIYMGGISMGGCGTLGIGMPNGNIFAAIMTGVPAGTAYASYRMGRFAPLPAYDASQDDRDTWLKRASAFGLQDPPVMIDFSSQNDSWAVTQPPLVHAANAGRLPLILSWGPFGHTAFASSISQYPVCQVVLAYPWLEIRRNEAYPVFTNASCDQQSPWLNGPVDYDNTGQTNAYFRWKNKRDTPSAFAMQLWIAHPQVNGKVTMPATAFTDITLRRLQQFKVRAGQRYSWQLFQDGRQIAAGRATADNLNLLTIPRVALTVTPVELLIKVVE